GLQGGPEPVVPPQRLGSRGERQDLHVRRRHHQRVRVPREQRDVAIERSHFDAPQPVLHVGGVEDARQFGGQRAFACVIGSGGGAGPRVRAAGEGGDEDDGDRRTGQRSGRHDYFNASAALRMPSIVAASSFAAPGSPSRRAKPSAPFFANATFSSFLPSSNFSETVSSGLSRPV